MCIENLWLVEKALEGAGQTGYHIHLAIASNFFLDSSYVVVLRSESPDKDDASQHILTLRDVLENNQECVDLYAQYDAQVPELLISSRSGNVGGSLGGVL